MATIYRSIVDASIIVDADLDANFKYFEVRVWEDGEDKEKAEIFQEEAEGSGPYNIFLPQSYRQSVGDIWFCEVRIVNDDEQFSEWIQDTDTDPGPSSVDVEQKEGSYSLVDYVTRDGLRELYGPWDAGFDITAPQFHSDVGGGSPPLTVVSTTLVDNLNADLLDGVEEAAFSLADGTRNFTGVVGGVDPTASNHLATKEYVDQAVSFIAEYYYNDTASDIGGIYYVMQEQPTGEVQSTFPTGPLGTGDGQALTNWATIVGIPGVTNLKSGTYIGHIHAAKTAGTKPVTLYFELYTRTSGGVETLQATSESTGLITAVNTGYEIHANVGDDVDILSTDRIIIKWLADVGVAGSNATITLYAEGNNNSVLEIPTSTEVLSSVFVRRDGTTPLTAPWDAEQDITAPEFIGDVTADWVQFDTSFADGVEEGRVQWNSEDGTLEYGLPGGNVNLQVGQEVLVKATNKSGVTIPNGACVYVDGAQGSRPTIALARADAEATAASLAVATEEILNNESGYVTVIGLVRDVDTAGMAAGSVLYLSPTTAGEYTTTRPTAPDYKVFMGYVLFENASSGIIIVSPIVQPTLMALSDVFEEAPADNDFLQWDSVDARFELTDSPVVEGDLSVVGDTDLAGDLNFSGGGVSYITTTGTEDEIRISQITTGALIDAFSVYADDTNIQGNLNITEYIYHTGDTNTYQRFQADSWKLYIGGQQAAVISTGKLAWSQSAGYAFTLWESATEGQTPEFKVSGFRTGDSKRTLLIGVGVDAADTASFDGVSNYWFDGSIEAVGTVKAEHLYSTDDLEVDGSATIGESLTVDGSASFIKVMDSLTYSSFINLEANSTPLVTLRGHGANASGGIRWQDGAGNNEWRIETNSVFGIGLEFIEVATVRMYLEPGGNLGIGETDPDQKLHVNAGATNLIAKFESTDDTGAIEVRDDDSTGYFGVKDSTIFIGGGYGARAANLNIEASTGQVGIGIFAATRTLHVYASTTADIKVESADASNAQYMLTNSANEWILRNTSSGTLTIVDGSDTRWTMDTSGNIVTVADFTVGDDHTVIGDLYVTEWIYRVGDTNTGIQFEEDQITIGAGGVSYLRLDDNAVSYIKMVSGQSFEIRDDSSVAALLVDNDTLSLSSDSFTSGVFGDGWRIKEVNSEWAAEFDRITVRGTIEAFVFKKNIVQASNAMLLVTDSCKLDSDILAGDTVIDVVENTLLANDVVLIQDEIGGSIYREIITITSVLGDQLTVTRGVVGAAKAWPGGTVLTRIGNSATASRQGAILLDASTTDSPFIDILGVDDTSDISSTYTESVTDAIAKVKVRLGQLSGIIDSDVGLTGTDEYGMYANSVYLKGTIIASTFKTNASSGKRVVMDDTDNDIQIFDDNNFNRVLIGEYELGPWTDVFGLKLDEPTSEQESSNIWITRYKPSSHGRGAIRIDDGGNAKPTNDDYDVSAIEVVGGVLTDNAYFGASFIWNKTTLTTGNKYGVFVQNQLASSGDIHGGYFYGIQNPLGTGDVFGLEVIGSHLGSSGDAYGIHVTASGASADTIYGIYIDGGSVDYSIYADDGPAYFADNITSAAIVQAEHLYSTDDLIVDGQVGIGTPVVTNVQLAVTGAITVRDGDFIGWNTYYDSGWKHWTDGFAAYLKLEGDGRISINLSTSALAGAAQSKAEVMTFEQGGQIGINQPNPAYDFDVTGDIRATDDVIAEGDFTAGAATTQIQFPSISGGYNFIQGQYDTDDFIMQSRFDNVVIQAGVTDGNLRTITLRSGLTGDAIGIAASVTPNVTIYNDLYMSQYLRHTGDTNTHIRFQTDDLQLVAGGDVGVHATGSALNLVPNAEHNATFFLSAGVGENPSVYIYGDDGGSPKYGYHQINASGEYWIVSEDHMVLSSGDRVYIGAAAGSSMYFDAGDIFYWRDQDGGDATRMSLDSATGDLTVTGEVNVGDDLNVTDDLYTTGTKAWLNSSGNAYLVVDRGLAARRGVLAFVTAGDPAESIPVTGLQWCVGMTDSDDAGDGSQFFIGQNTTGVDANLWIESTGIFGFNTTTPVDTVHIRRSYASAGNVEGILRLELYDTDGFTDGSGPKIWFTGGDAAADDNPLGSIGFARDGADNEGKFVLAGGTNGAEEFFTITAAGAAWFYDDVDIDGDLNVDGTAQFDSGITVDTNILLGAYLQHLGDADTYLLFGTNTIQLIAGGGVGLTVYGTYVGLDEIIVAGGADTAQISTTDAVTAAVTTGLVIQHHSSGTPAAGFGVAIDFDLENGSGSSYTENAARIVAYWTDPTISSEDSQLDFYVMEAGSSGLGMSLTSNGSLDVAYDIDAGHSITADADIHAGRDITADGICCDTYPDIEMIRNAIHIAAANREAPEIIQFSDGVPELMQENIDAGVLVYCIKDAERPRLSMGQFQFLLGGGILQLDERLISVEAELETEKENNKKLMKTLKSYDDRITALERAA